MINELNRIVENAQHGKGPCNGCPSHKELQGKYVNPGLLNPNAEIMFITMDPSHKIDWNKYASWTEYNQEYSRKFATWRGGEKIKEIIQPLNLTLDDVWLGDSIKCPVDNSLYRFGDSSKIEMSFDHCQEYLVNEIDIIDPVLIVTLGADTASRLLNMVFDMNVDGLKSGTSDCGKVFDTDPPVIVSPHWSHGWLDRSPSGQRNLDIVQDSLVNVYNERMDQY